MSKRKQKAKKEPRDNTRTTTPVTAPATPKRTTARPAAAKQSGPKRALTFGPETYKWLGIGFALVLVGLLLMAGARNPDPTVFDTSDMYSFRRITLAPIVILAGLGVTTFAILKK